MRTREKSKWGFDFAVVVVTLFDGDGKSSTFARSLESFLRDETEPKLNRSAETPRLVNFILRPAPPVVNCVGASPAVNLHLRLNNM